MNAKKAKLIRKLIKGSGLHLSPPGHEILQVNRAAGWELPEGYIWENAQRLLSVGGPWAVELRLELRPLKSATFKCRHGSFKQVYKRAKLASKIWDKSQ